MERESILLVRASVEQARLYGEGGLETRKGTKHFRPGAKVYVIDAHWGMCDAVTVIGHHRASGRYTKLDMSVKQLKNFRLGRAYSPKVICLVEHHFSGQYNEKYVHELLEVLPKWKAGS